MGHKFRDVHTILCQGSRVTSIVGDLEKEFRELQKSFPDKTSVGLDFLLGRLFAESKQLKEMIYKEWGREPDGS